MSADGSGSDGESESGDSGPGRRETAQRLFAAEFEDATHSYSESDEERAPNYVVAPSGARVNRLFAVGVLTEVEAVSENVLRGRIVDPTGAFVTYAGQYQPDALAFLERTDPPAFVAVTGKARTFQPEDSDVIYTSVRPETMNEVDAETRDRWVVNTAERTRERIETLRDAKARAETGDDLESSLRAEGVPEALAAGAPRALDAYGTTDDYLDALRELARDAVGVVAGQREEAGSLDLAPGEGEDREPEPVTRVEEEADERESREPDPVGTEESAGQPSAPEPAEEPGETVEEEASETGEFDEPAAENVESGGEAETAETEEMYEFDEEERQQVEEEHGLEFSTGGDVEPAEELGNEEAEESEMGESEDGLGDFQSGLSDEAEGEEPGEPDEGADEGASEGASEEAGGADFDDPEEAAVEAMDDLGDGGPVEREELVSELVSRHGVSEDAAADAIQDALMSGRCYESGDDELTPI